MVGQHCDWVLTWDGGERDGDRAPDMFDVPVGFVTWPSDLYDRVAAFTCDVLGAQSIERRGAEADYAPCGERAAGNS